MKGPTMMSITFDRDEFTRRQMDYNMKKLFGKKYNTLYRDVGEDKYYFRIVFTAYDLEVLEELIKYKNMYSSIRIS